MSRSHNSTPHRLLAKIQNVRKAIAAQELFEAQTFEGTRRLEEQAARDLSQQTFENWLRSLEAERIDTDQLDTLARALTTSESDLRAAVQSVGRAVLRTEGCQTRYAERSVQAEHAEIVLDRVRKGIARDQQEREAASFEDRVSFDWMRP